MLSHGTTCLHVGRWIPVVAYVVLRNLWPSARGRFLGLLRQVGKITLELYLLQVCPTAEHVKCVPIALEFSSCTALTSNVAGACVFVVTRFFPTLTIPRPPRGQHHLWLGSHAKTLLVVVPGMPMVNFALVSVGFIVAAHQVRIVRTSLQAETAGRRLTSRVCFVATCTARLLAPQ